MEHLIFIEHYKTEKIIALWSIDTLTIIQLLRGENFCIKYMLSNDKDNKMDYIRRPEDSYWVNYGDESHTVEIQGFSKDCDDHEIFECLIEIEGVCIIEQLAGQLFITYKSKDQIKDGVSALMKSYGYFAAEKILDFVMQFDKCIPIDSLQGIEPENLNEEQLNFALEICENIEKENMRYEKLTREIDDSEDSMPI